MDAFCPLLVFHIHVHEHAHCGLVLSFYKARYEEDPARKEFARAYLFYKLVFFIAGAVVLLILIWIGLGLLDQLLAYMEML